jgi:hypothetical protein
LIDLIKPDRHLIEVPDQPGRFRLVREMGCTEKEFLYWMPGALGTDAFEKVEGEIRLEQSRLQIRIRFQTLEPRRIALVSIPRLLITFEFETPDVQDIGVFLKRFDAYTRRGGG